MAGPAAARPAARGAGRVRAGALVTASLELRAVSFAYPGGEPVLRAISFTVAPGERVALLGPNGAGKSTLLQHLNGLLLPTAGQLFVGGVPVVEANLRSVRQRIGFVFQDPDDQLFLPTLLEDVAFAPLNAGEPRAQARARAHAALAAVGIDRHADRAAHHLSGGEKRLAALATVLVSRPQVLVLDEPTGDLDARARLRIVRLLQERPETLLVATHDLEVAGAVCTRALALADGSVAYDGPLDRLRADRDRLGRLGLLAAL
ncbi:MAG: ABC transporter ATP-binding protein [Gemmatimonadetes bacterium]|nr:ABC transporter ATP-binding protein [Gemmatimonadota bacterium]